MLEPLEGRVQRPLLDEQDAVGQLADARGDRPAVLRFERQGLEDQEVERALDEVDRFHRYDYLHQLV
jgi:hypothetical protein